MGVFLMYNLLIIDDEPIIVDGLYDLFSTIDDMELEVLRAYSGREALEIMMKMNIDVVLTDICMPDIDGIMVQKEINNQWPACKVIFLTGFDDFNYIQSAVRNDTVDYILKTEDDLVIINAVKKAITILEDEVRNKQFIENAKGNMLIALPLLQKKYLMDLLEGIKSLNEESVEEFIDLELPFDCRRPVMLLTARVDDWENIKSMTKKMEIIYGIEAIAQSHLSNACNFLSITYDRTKLLWVIQSNTKFIRIDSHKTVNDDEIASLSSVKSFVQGTMEPLQRQCSDLLKVSVSFGASEITNDWSNLPRMFFSLGLIMSNSAGMEKKALLIDKSQVNVAMEEKGIELQSEAFNRNKKSKAALLQAYIEDGQQQEYVKVLNSVLDIGNDDLFKSGTNMEIYYTVAIVLLSHINSQNLYGKINAAIDLGKLLKMDEHQSWRCIKEYFMELSSIIFEFKKNEYIKHNSRIIDYIKKYIVENIGGDLSVTNLAELIHYNPSYLSRLFKKYAGESISDYISDVRFDCAQKLLQKNNMRINEMSMYMGFKTSSYFIRFFKKKVNMTPQEFRDSQRC